jgi:hypothetical protein
MNTFNLLLIIIRFQAIQSQYLLNILLTLLSNKLLLEENQTQDLVMKKLRIF